MTFLFSSFALLGFAIITPVQKSVNGTLGGASSLVNSVDSCTLNGMYGGNSDLENGFQHSVWDNKKFVTDLDGVDQPQLEPIAVNGFSLKFPQDATSPEAFGKMLMEKRCSMTEWPKERLNLPPWRTPGTL